MILSILKILWYLMRRKKPKQGKNKKRNRPLVSNFDKLLLAIIFLPPVYILARYLRWYIHQDIEIKAVDPEENEAEAET